MVSYIGSKSRISKFIIPHIPLDIETYIECFGGAYWNYFNMDITKYPNLKTIIYNDFNPLNYNLFNCVKTNPQLLLEICEDIPVEDVNLFNEYKKELYSTELDLNQPNYDIAFKYVYILTQVFSGYNPEKGNMVKNGGYFNKEGKYIGKFEIFRNKLRDIKWINKFKSITFVHNNDYKDIIKQYDSPTTYFYLDPPYFTYESYYSNHDFNGDEHKKLSNILHSIKGKFSLSYYDFTQLEEWYPKNEFIWKSQEFTKASGAAKGKTQKKSEEILIMNYQIEIR
jgi:DNA adenine methylase